MNLEPLLQRYFGHPTFRNGQRAVVEHVMDGENALVVMPTGHGKSLCYQLPALARSGTTIVVSPLIALMKDQVDSLRSKNIAATSINSSLDREERQRRIQGMQEGKYRLVYVAPERFNKRFMDALGRTEVGLFAIDEAHCISQWGHDFRPDYLRLGAVWSQLGETPLIALTATATPEVQDDILAQLRLQSVRRFVTGFDRENIRLEVANARTQKTKFSMLPGLLRTVPALVYCATRKHVEEVNQSLNAQGVRASAYHAGLDHETRRQVQEDFIGGRIPVVVATNAFGMGVDKSDIRTIVHFDVPGTLEAYYQEIGRAGRDGRPAKAILLFRNADRQLQEFFIQNAHPPAHDIQRLYRFLQHQPTNPIWWTTQTIAEHLDADERMVNSCLSVLRRSGLAQRAAGRKEGQSIFGVELLQPDQALTIDESEMTRRRHHAIAQLDRMMDYGQSACQRLHVLHYFGERPSWERCGRCTGCDANRPMVQQARKLTPHELETVRKILACMARMRRPFSTSLIAKVVTGSRDKSVRAWGFEKLSTWGILQGITQARVESILGAMEIAGLVEVQLTTKNVRGTARTWKNLGMTSFGSAVMRGDETQVELVMPPDAVSVHERLDDPWENHDGTYDEDLLAQLRQARWKMAQAANVPAYVVASNRTLLAIATLRPTSETALSEIHGMGRQRMMRYGASFIEVVRGWTGC